MSEEVLIDLLLEVNDFDGNVESLEDLVLQLLK